MFFVELGGGVDDVPGWWRDGHTSNLASDGVDGWLTWRCPWSSVPLTVSFVLRLDSVLRFVVITAFCVHHLAALRSVGFGWLQDRSENHHSDSIGDNSFRCRQEFHLLIRGLLRSPVKRMKHKVVKLILIYFNTNNAFYKNEHITLAFK